jgi:hypothetical protein
MDSALTVAAIGVGGTVIVGVAGFWASVRNTNKLAGLTEQGQLTDRYSKAIEQLGSDKLDVRIGGIYALERIARDSPRDHPTIMEVLGAFIRGHSHERWPLVEPDGEPPPRSTRPDVQAAATVIGRRIVQYDSQPVNLIGADLRGAHLTDADLSRAHLSSAILIGADLRGADLTGAHLDRADLSRAVLIDAVLIDAQLFNTRLSSANLTRANFAGAKIMASLLTDARFTDVRWPTGKRVPPGWQRDTDSGRLKQAARDSGDAAAEDVGDADS